LEYILKNFDEVSKSKGFEKLARENVDLAIEILRKR
jgi:hypothetical protein